MITKIGVPFKGLAGDGFSGSYKGIIPMRLAITSQTKSSTEQ